MKSTVKNKHGMQAKKIRIHSSGRTDLFDWNIHYSLEYINLSTKLCL
jgi:hypothetical protein